MGLWTDRLQNGDGLKKKKKNSPEINLKKKKNTSFAFRMKSGDKTENLTELRHNQQICLTSK